jgi:hypothetical protein
MSRGLQVFIHRNYDAIKLIALAIILGVVILAFYTQLATNAENSTKRAKAVLEVVNIVKAENEKQTTVINRQFQALCFLLVETSGREALKQLDPPLEQQCLDLASELREQERERQASVGSSPSSDTSNPRPSASTSPKTPSNPAQQEQSTPSEPEQDLGPLLQPTVDLIDDVLGGLGL